MPSSLALTPADGRDEPLLRRIFVEAHCGALAEFGLDPIAFDQLVDLQLRARDQQYAAAHPDGQQYIVEIGGTAVGSCWYVLEVDHLRVLDIAVLRPYRRQGIASCVLRRLMDEASLR